MNELNGGNSGAKKKGGEGLKFLADVLYVLVFLFVAFLAYGNFPNRWYRVLYITSGSMTPAIRSGDLIIITPPPPVLKPGMILTYAVDGDLVTHRLVEFGEYGILVTKGDANDTMDNWGISTEAVVGIYRLRIPWLGYLARLADLTDKVDSGAWFFDSVELTGQLGAGMNWKTPTPVEELFAPAPAPQETQPVAEIPRLEETPAASEPTPIVETPPITVMPLLDETPITIEPTSTAETPPADVIPPDPETAPFVETPISPTATPFISPIETSVTESPAWTPTQPITPTIASTDLFPFSTTMVATPAPADEISTPETLQ